MMKQEKTLFSADQLQKIIDLIDAGQYKMTLANQDDDMIELIDAGEGGIQYIFPNIEALDSPPAGVGNAKFEIGEYKFHYEKISAWDDASISFDGVPLTECINPDDEEAQELVEELSEDIRDKYDEDVSVDDLFQAWCDVELEYALGQWEDEGFCVDPEEKCPTVYVADEYEEYDDDEDVEKDEEEEEEEKEEVDEEKKEDEETKKARHASKESWFYTIPQNTKKMKKISLEEAAEYVRKYAALADTSCP